MGETSYSHDRRVHYSSTVENKSREELFTEHKSKKEFKMNSKMNPENITVRESRDSDIHPKSLAIIIALDVTGSMGVIPEAILKEDLTHIMADILKAEIEHPQIMFLAIGDHTVDDAPLQVGQFESGDQELNMWLKNTWIESGGGAGIQESYNLAWIVAGHHTSIDCWEKRKQKGILITIGDENAYPTMSAEYLKDITGLLMQGDYSAEDMVKKAMETFNVYHIHTNDTGHRNNNAVMAYWKNLLGQSFSIVDSYKELPVKIAELVKQSINSDSPESSKTDEQTDDGIMKIDM